MSSDLIMIGIKRTSLRSARPVFIGSSNCDVSGDHWIQSQRRRWSMPSLAYFSHR